MVQICNYVYDHIAGAHSESITEHYQVVEQVFKDKELSVGTQYVLAVS